MKKYTSMNWWLMIIFALAFLVRLVNLDQSLWLDEATTSRVVSQFDYFSIIRQFSVSDFHPPLYYLLMKFWANIFGYSEISLRMPSVIFSLITGYFVYKIGKLLAEEKGGIGATLLFLFNPLIVYYSQEARMYMMATMFLTIGLYFFLLNEKKISGKRFQLSIKNLLLMNLFFLLSFYTFYGSIFLILAILIYFFYKRQSQNWLITFLFFSFSLIIISSLLFSQLVNAKISLNQVGNWSQVLGKASLKNLFLIPVKFSFGRIDFYPKWFYYFLAGLWTVFVFYCLLLSLKTKSLIKNLFVYLLTFPVILGFFISFITPLLQYFRFLYLVPIMAVLLSFSDNLKRKILIGGFFILSMIYLFNPQFHREDWRSLGKSLLPNIPVFMILSSADPLYYYRPDLKIDELRQVGYRILPSKIYIIPYTTEIYGFSYENILITKGYSLIKKQTFHRLTLEEWQKIK